MGKQTRFHHPDFSATVARRRTTEALMMLVYLYADVARVCFRIWPLALPSLQEKRRSAAAGRLRKMGIQCQLARGQPPILELEEEPRDAMGVLAHPERLWNRRWDRRWSVLVYDVPSTSDSYRAVLCRLLHRLRLGCLQRSVWVTPWDFRPHYDDLAISAHLNAYAYLFEARRVLGESNRDIVRNAWPWTLIEQEQTDYLRDVENWLFELQEAEDLESLVSLAQRECETYAQAMARDPLLPRQLHPKGYRGEKCAAAHTEFVTAMKSALRHAH